MKRNRTLIVTLGALMLIALFSIKLVFIINNENQLNEGIVALKKGNYKTGVPILYPLAEKGNKTALRVLIPVYVYGLGGLPKSREQALTYITLSGENIATKCYYYAQQFDSGVEIAKDEDEAIWWYIKAAEHGHKRAQKLLVEVYRDGLYGMPVDLEKSQYWAEKL